MWLKMLCVASEGIPVPNVQLALYEISIHTEEIKL